MESIIELRGIVKEYGKGDNLVCALNGIDLSIQKGAMLAIMGVSGSGKSTLLNVIGLLTTPSEGEYLLQGKQTSSLSQKQKAHARNSIFGFIVQDFALIEKLSVRQNISIPLAYREHKLRGKEKRERVEALLTKMGILDKADTLAQNLSGGQRQRVAIARALINNPEVILADEPTGALDSKTSQEIMGVLKNLNNEGKTVIVITHDKSVLDYCKQAIVISDGNLVLNPTL
jgi:putative ABC transport system ATP-binding protein